MAKGEWAKTTALIDEANEILAAESPMTLRQLFYRLVSSSAINNDKRSYTALCRVMTKARKDGRIDFDHMVDRSRPTYTPYVFDDPQDYARSIKSSYRKDYWLSQSWYVEIWTEKDSISGSIEPITDELGITVRVGRGYLSTTRKYEIARHFMHGRGKDKSIQVFYLGDFDPSGMDLEKDAVAEIRKHGAQFNIDRLAIHHADIARFNLPPLRVKDDDSRSKNFKRSHGNKCVELDALPVEELRRRIRESVSALIDHERWDRAVAVEKVEIASILEGMKSWPGMERANG